MKIYFNCFLIPAFVFVGNFHLMSQDKKSFNHEQLEKFVSVYLESKRISVNQDSIIADVLKKSNLDKESYLKILRNSIEDIDKTALKQNELLIKEISRIKNELEKIKENNAEALCKKYSLEKVVYSSILESYKSAPSFQNSLVVYFEEYINRQK